MLIEIVINEVLFGTLKNEKMFEQKHCPKVD
jgi:hypothetical protein